VQSYNIKLRFNPKLYYFMSRITQDSGS